MIWLVALVLLLMVLNALLLIPGRLRRTRIAAILVAPLSAFVILVAVHSFEGWPVPSSPPVGSRFVAAVIDEPNAIYLWVIPNGSRPRAYRVAYSDALYQQVLNAQAAVRRGEAIRVGNGRHGQPRGAALGQRLSFRLEHYRLPPVQAPRKRG